MAEIFPRLFFARASPNRGGVGWSDVSLIRFDPEDVILPIRQGIAASVQVRAIPDRAFPVCVIYDLGERATRFNRDPRLLLRRKISEAQVLGYLDEVRAELALAGSNRNATFVCQYVERATRRTAVRRRQRARVSDFGFTIRAAP